LHDLALQYAERAIANGATSARAYEAIGRIELHRNHPTQALVWYDLSLKNARTAPVLANLGYAHMLQSEWESARASLEEAIRLDDTLEVAHNNLAIVLSKTGDDNGALTHLLRTGRPAVAYNNMGVLCQEAQRLHDAQDYFEKALRLEPNYEVARRNLTALEVLLQSPSIIELPASPREDAAPRQAGETHFAAQPQTPAEAKTPNGSRDEAGASATKLAERPSDGS
jgi:Flp pilus assembly protein TadD